MKTIFNNLLFAVALLAALATPSRVSAQGFDITDCSPPDEPAFGVKHHAHLCADGRWLRSIDGRFTCPEEVLIARTVAYLSDADGATDTRAEVIAAMQGMVPFYKDPYMTPCRLEYLKLLVAKYKELVGLLADKAPAAGAVAGGGVAAPDPAVALRRKQAMDARQVLLDALAPSRQKLGVKKGPPPKAK